MKSVSIGADPADVKMGGCKHRYTPTLLKAWGHHSWPVSTGTGNHSIIE